ncbi:hypothetical protein [Clostridium sp. ZBS13]
MNNAYTLASLKNSIAIDESLENKIKTYYEINKRQYKTLLILINFIGFK